MNKQIRTRFAPSPTGMLHIGGLRTTLFSWLWARKNGGLFILRLEDTDQDRIVSGAREQIMDSIKWLGMDWDFGPDKPSPDFGSCVQSERTDDYLKFIEPLLESGVAYHDWTSPEELTKLRETAQANKQPFVFRKSMAKLEGEPGQGVIRIAVPDEVVLEWQDSVKGAQRWVGKDIGDFVAIKSDGFPTYQFANVVDDHLMAITHVIRADEWLSSTPKHIFLYDSLGWDRPEFGHVPPVLGPDGKKKLSKRDGAKDAADYRAEGYMPEAVTNFLALLGWNPGTEQEIFSPGELINSFELSRIQKSGAKFDPVRLDWMNGMHIRNMPIPELVEYADSNNWWPESASNNKEVSKDKVMGLVFERIKKWSDLKEYTNFFFEDPQAVTEADLTKETGFSGEQAVKLLTDANTILQASDFSEADLETKLYGYAKEHDLKVGKFFMLIRLKVTGSKFSPGLFETLSTIGKETSLRRLG